MRALGSGEDHRLHGAGRCASRGKDGIARAIYTTAKGERVIVLHAFVKKTQKTPQRALEIVRERAMEVR
jgi:phage-related protein